MSDTVARFKQHMWANHAIDPQAIVVRLRADGKVMSFGVDSNVAQHRWIAGAGTQRPHSWGVTFDGYTVPEENFDGVSGVQQSRGIPR